MGLEPILSMDAKGSPKNSIVEWIVTLMEYDFCLL